MIARRTPWVAIAFVLALCCCAPTAHAQVLPHPQLVTLDVVTQALSDARAPVTASDVLQAYAHYLHGYEEALAECDAAFAQLRTQSRVAPGAFLGPNDATKLMAIEEKAQQAEQALIQALVDRLASAAPGHEAQFAAARSLLELRAWYAHFRGGATNSFQVYLPDDSSMMLAFTVRTGGSTPGEFDELARAASLSHLSERLSAIRDYAKAQRETRMHAARLAEKSGLVGRTWEEAMALDGARANEAARASDPQKWDAAAYQAAWDESAARQLTRMATGLAPDHPSWLPLARAQYRAFQEVEPRLPAHVIVSLERTWLPALLCGLRAGMLDQLPLPAGAYANSPADYAHLLMRIQDVSEESRKQLKQLGLQWMADDRALIRQALQKSFESGVMQEVTTARNARAKEAVAAAAAVLGAPEMVPSQPGGSVAFPTVTLLPNLSPQEEPLYGRAPATTDRRPAATAQLGWGDATILRPNALPPDSADQFATWLELQDAQRPTLSAIVSDAQERWKQVIQPLITKADEPAPTWGGGSTAQRAKFCTDLLEAHTAAVQAFKAAAEFDAALISDIRAAVGEQANPHVLSVFLAARRTAEAVRLRSWFNRRSTQAVPVDVPYAVLHAPLSTEGRQRALLALAPAAGEWAELGRKYQECATYGRVLNQLNHQLTDYVMEGDQAGAQERSNRAQQFREDIPINLAERERLEAAWITAESRALPAVAGVLSPSDVLAWQGWIQRCQWPRMYPNLAACGQAAAAYQSEATDPELAQQVATMVQEAQRAAQACGDRGVRAMKSIQPQVVQGPAGQRPQLPENSARMEVFAALLAWHEALLAERLRLVLPPEHAARLPRTRATNAMDNLVKVSAP